MKKPAAITASQIMKLIENQKFKCALTGRDLTPETASIDHIMPLSRNGSHDLENIWVIDHKVNMAKGTMTTDEFVAMCREVANHANAPATSCA